MIEGSCAILHKNNESLQISQADVYFLSHTQWKYKSYLCDPSHTIRLQYCSNQNESRSV